ncbi:hypothetical protein [Tepidibacillus fermentans]|uniref:DUF2680 domain-containing protein n=1 Tax=Tepidibacillus fermentans TaxID=1281767 RepID=A0A4R3K6E5_9BACI|nr:hypothetical protein [Tepidibacillus fermentans]TCS78360.1 hypothetical protein EDD72_1288 [Tepidibacillus fermentans]
MKKNKTWTNRVLLTVIGLLVIFGSVAFAEEDGGIVKQNLKKDNISSWQPLLGMGRYFGGTMRTTIAKTLNMTEEQVYLERLKGKSIADLAKEKGIPIEKIMTEMKAAKKAQVDQLVKEKKITEDQAKFILNRMETNLRAAIERKGIGPRGNGGIGKGRCR